MATNARHRSLRNTVATWTGIGGRRQLLYVSAESLIVLRHYEEGWRLAKVFCLQESNDMPLGLSSQVPSPWAVPEDFRRWIEDWRGDRFRFLIDSVDEEVEVDELPRVHGRDRDKLLTRRLRQRFRDAALTTWIAPRKTNAAPWKRRAATPGGPASGGAGECTMMANLRQRNPMSLWIEAAVETGARVASVESPALRAPAVLRAAGARPTALLVSVQPAGLRETLVQNGQIRFTRLLPMPAPAAWSQVASELDRTIRFLMMSRASLRPLIQAGNFPVHVIREGIDERGGTDPIPATLQLDGDIVVPLVPLDTTAVRRPRVVAGEQAPLPPADLGAVPVLLAQRGAGRPGGYASRAMRANWRSARSLASVWSLALIGLVAMVGANVLIGYTLHDVVDPAVQRQRVLQIASVRSQTQELERQLAGMPMSAKDMEGVVELAAQLQSRHVDALSTLRLLAAGIDPDAALTINDVSWEPQHLLMTNGAAVRTAPSGSASSAPVPADPAGATSNTVVRIAGVVDVTLPKELANRKVDALLERLRATCACEGKVVELPYNPSMEVAYANSLRKPNLEHPPHFALELDRPSTWIAKQNAAGPDAKKDGPAPGSAAQTLVPQARGHRDA